MVLQPSEVGEFSHLPVAERDHINTYIDICMYLCMLTYVYRYICIEMYEYKQYINDTIIFFVMEKVEGITTVYIYI